MKNRKALFSIGVVAILALSASAAFSQVQAAQNRIPQQVSINGQLVNGAYVTAAGGQLQSFTCPTPQRYSTADASSQGWACYDQTSGVWLLNAVPPAQAQANSAPTPVQQQPVYQQAPPPVVYQQAQPAVVYQTPAAVVYQTPQVIYPTVIYQQPPTVIYQQPAQTVIYSSPRPVIVEPAYSASVVLGRAAINAAGRIAAAAIDNSHRSHPYYYERAPVRRVRR